MNNKVQQVEDTVMNRRTWLVLSALATVAFIAGGTSPALASSHREAPFITRMPKVDNTDVYAFRSYEPGREQFVTILADFYPFQDPFGGPIYFPMDPDAEYQIHIDSNGDAREDMTFSFDFNQTLLNGRGIVLNVGGKALSIPIRQIGQVTQPADPELGYREDYGITLIRGDRRTGARSAITNAANGAARFEKPLDNIGLKTTPDYPAYARQFVYNVGIPGCGLAGRAFVGQREDPFVVNVGETFDLVNYVPIQGGSGGFPGGITQSQANDDVQGIKNVTTLAIEVPIACLTAGGNGVIGVWSSASLPQNRVLSAAPTFVAPDQNSGSLVQVSRLGAPLVNELVIGMDKKDLFNAAHPTQDAALADFVTNPTLPAILDALFRAPVNQTLGTNIPNLAPQFFPRKDLVAAFLTGIPTLNQQSTITPSEMLRLNTRVSPKARAAQSNLGVVGDDLAGFPNGRRPGDDVVDIILRVAMGRLCYPVPINGQQTSLGLCTPEQAPVGNVPFTDGAPVNATFFQNAFPYINNAVPGSPDEVRDARANSVTPQ
jgi:hypothetical protein